MEKYKLLILKDEMLEYLKSYGYRDSTVNAYNWEINSLIAHIHENPEDHFNDELVKPHLNQSELRFKSGAISRDRYISIKKVCRYFLEFCKTRSIRFAPPKDTDLTPYYIEIISLIFTNSKWSLSRQNSCRSYSRPFFKWLLSHGYNDLSSVNESLIKNYLTDCSKRMNNQSLSSTRFHLKSLFALLHEKNVVSNSYEESFAFIIPVERKIQKSIPQSEVATVLESIDRTSSIGKRNYAMIMTALKTGLRQCDIINLKLCDIDWQNGKLNISQSKTGKALTLPLTRDFGEAISDYLLHGRRKTSSEYVFVSELPPFSKLSRKAIYFHFNEYRRRCGMSNCSFHGLRRMLGSSMVAGGVRVDMIPDILGHSDLESSRPYIYANHSTMKECSLALDMLPDIKR